MQKIYKILLSSTIVLLGSYYVWHVNFNYRFETISEGKVYKSALIPPQKLEGYLRGKKIKTVIDLLHPNLNDKLNPANITHVNAEDNAIKRINREYHTNIKHINIPSDQVPTEENLKKFFAVLDNPNNYPVLIHCYHGTGRAAIYSALYRIEYEKWSNENARSKTRVIVSMPGYRSAFADGRKKGDFLMHYTARKERYTFNLKGTSNNR